MPRVRAYVALLIVAVNEAHFCISSRLFSALARKSLFLIRSFTVIAVNLAVNKIHRYFSSPYFHALHAKREGAALALFVTKQDRLATTFFITRAIDRLMMREEKK